MAHGKGVQLIKRFEYGIALSLMWHFHGSRGLMALHGLIKLRSPLNQRGTTRAIGTTMVAIEGIVTTIEETMIEEATKGEAVAVEVVFALTIGTKVRLVAPISSLTCHAIAGDLISTVPIANAWYPCPRQPLTSLLSLYSTRVHTHPLSTEK
jgi:hypothetical protein